MIERKIKQLKTQLKKLISDLEVFKIEVANKQREYNLKLLQKSNIEDEIRKLENNNKSLRISEHAIIRYLERIRGLDIKEIENEIITDEIKSMVNTLGGTGKYPNNNFNVVIKDYIVTTIT